jgi:hypothetical protein
MSAARGAESITYFAIPEKARNALYQQTSGMWISVDLALSFSSTRS